MPVPVPFTFCLLSMRLTVLVYKVFVVCLFSFCDENLIAHTALQIEIGAVDVVNKLETVQVISNTCAADYSVDKNIDPPGP